ncbi:FAS1-like dehydratase domain-containing protein [Nocardioides houyundeii]|uniref:FAS1-like dehydratase domain-containing protein n=1 Tax=Nocardioides houyundeii TaxID=2045452 RepID=UPI0018EFADCE|nr:MaoC family dehydratase N-terminal domain-containing protein [Nocardioides houyundeii]
MTTTLITDEMLGLVGRELGRRVSHAVAASDIRRWAIAVYWPEPPPARFVAPSSPLIAPEDFNPFAWSVAWSSHAPTVSLTEGMESALGIAGPSLPHILNGGMQTEYGAPIRAGDTITSVNVLAEYRERVGQHGSMLFTVTEDTWTNQHDQHVKTHRVTTIRY